MGNFLDAQGHLPNSEGSGAIWPKFELFPYFMPGFVTCKFDEDQIKTEGVSVETLFSPF